MQMTNVQPFWRWLGQRMPRCGDGCFHVVSNSYTPEIDVSLISTVPVSWWPICTDFNGEHERSDRTMRSYCQRGFTEAATWSCKGRPSSFTCAFNIEGYYWSGASGPLKTSPNSNPEKAKVSTWIFLCGEWLGSRTWADRCILFHRFEEWQTWIRQCQCKFSHYSLGLVLVSIDAISQR